MHWRAATGPGLLVALLVGPAIGAAPAEPPPVFVPRSLQTAPADGFGDAVRLGARLMTDTRAAAPRHVGNGLRCASCHLDAGSQAGAAPLWAAYVNYPAFRAKNSEVNSFQKRVQECFLYSMNGNPPPLGSRELIAIESYAFFMAKGLPLGETPPGRGFPVIAAPPQPVDFARGRHVYNEVCAACHGPTGAGQQLEKQDSMPPLWGPQSYNWGAGMATIDRAAAFIHANMPLGQGGTLSVQQAWDVASFIDSQIRPQDPRFAGDVAATRAAHHNSPHSMYGRTVAGAVLGAAKTTPPSGMQTRRPNSGSTAQ
jgi:thiosulfate dehydrogenase